MFNIVSLGFVLGKTLRSAKCLKLGRFKMKKKTVSFKTSIIITKSGRFDYTLSHANKEYLIENINTYGRLRLSREAFFIYIRYSILLNTKEDLST